MGKWELPGTGLGAAALPAPCYSFSRRETFGLWKDRGSGRVGVKAESRLRSGCPTSLGWGDCPAGDTSLQGWGECIMWGLVHLLQQQSPYIRRPFLAPPFTHVPPQSGLSQAGRRGESDPCNPCAG